MTDTPEAVLARAYRLKRFGFNSPAHPQDIKIAHAQHAALRAAGYAIVETELLTSALSWLNSAYDEHAEHAEVGDKGRHAPYIYDAVRPVKERLQAAAEDTGQ